MPPRIGDHPLSVGLAMFRDLPGTGNPISARTRLTARTLEGYMEASARPRWMERILEIEHAIARERSELAEAYDALRAECGDDRKAFAARWREIAQSRDHGDVNELIRHHNKWFPVERDLPMDPRTGDFRPIHGRSHVRRELSADWVLELFPV